MLSCFTAAKPSHAIPIHMINAKDYSVWEQQQTPLIQNWMRHTQFNPALGGVRLVPDSEGRLAFVLCCLVDNNDIWQAGSLPLTLPEGVYYFEQVKPVVYESYALGWGLGAYQFTKYKPGLRQAATLYIPDKACLEHVDNLTQSIYLVRDLINTPTEDLGPTELATATASLAKCYAADFKQIIGEALLDANYPLIHLVGRASDEMPRLLDFAWGKAHHPKVTLVGKGVCFDSGGLDIKPAVPMQLMKKDMGGAAHVLGLARMIMQANLPIRLRVIIPAVENVISGNAYRPGDVIKSRRGLTVEIGNTDAEGRLILADALTEAASENPKLLIDMSTLTGAARIALGPDLPVVFSNEKDMIKELLRLGEEENDPLWQLPLFSPYREYINSPIADLNNTSSEPYGGAITAALFLREFVPDTIPWFHFDIMAWNMKPRPGRPQGGEAMGLRALFRYMKMHFQ